MKNFKEWYAAINEELAEPVANAEPAVAEPTATEPTSQPGSGREDMIHDVDAIITSLEALSGELKEQLVRESGLASVAAAGVAGAALVGLGMGAKKLYDASVTAPKARKAQAKVNAMNLKVAGVENAISNADKEQKDKLQAKLDAAKEAAKELQTSVDDKYANASGVVKKALSAERAKGRMEVLRATLGDASPEQQKQIKDQLVKLKNKVAKDEAEFKQEVKDAKEETPTKELDKVKELTAKEGKQKSSPKEGDISPKESLVTRAQDLGLHELATEILEKESWQLNNTTLYNKYNEQLTRLESTEILNESKYVTGSIKDRFSRLL